MLYTKRQIVFVNFVEVTLILFVNFEVLSKKVKLLVEQLDTSEPVVLHLMLW